MGKWLFGRETVPSRSEIRESWGKEMRIVTCVNAGLSFFFFPPKKIRWNLFPFSSGSRPLHIQEGSDLRVLPCQITGWVDSVKPFPCLEVWIPKEREYKNSE